MRASAEGEPWARVYGVYWVVFDEIGAPVRWSEAPSAPVGATHAELLEGMRIYNQAIHKHILDFRTGLIVEDPVISRGGNAAKGA